jgi:hypothetical protein
MKLLSIAIPTRNRPDKLISGLNLWLDQLSTVNSELVEIIIGDNSTNKDTNNKLSNNGLLDSIKYLNYGGDIGYAENLNKLALVSESKYLWFFADNDIIYDNALMTIIPILESLNDNIPYIAVDNDWHSEETNKIITKNRFFKRNGYVPGESVLNNKEEFYGLGGISTGIFRTKIIKHFIDKYNWVTDHQGALFAGISMYGKEILILKDSLYIDTYYKKHYKAKTKFEVTVESHTVTRAYIEKYHKCKIFNRSDWQEDMNDRIKTFFIAYVFTNKNFKFHISFKDIKNLCSFSWRSFYYLLFLKITYLINPSFLLYLSKLYIFIFNKDLTSVRNLADDLENNMSIDDDSNSNIHIGYKP